MMKRLLLALLFPVAAHAQLPPELDAYLEKARADWNVPGMAVAVVRDGKVVAAKGYGVRAVDRPERVDEHTVFDIASLAKSFTAAAVATLVDEGKMRWDDPVRRHLPSFELADPYRTQHVTMRDLLAHRTGLENANAMIYWSGHDTAEVVRRTRFLEERMPLRSGLVYSNAMYTVAGEAAAAAAKTSWSELVRTRVLEPLGMRESAAGVQHDRFANHAAPHSRIAGAQKRVRARMAMNALPAGGITSTASDITRWLLFHLGDGTWEGKRILAAATLEEMHSPQIVIPTTAAFRETRGVHYFGAYGLGWQVMDFRGRLMLWHSGNADGMPSYMAILPKEKIGVAVMINTWSAPFLHGALAARILDTLLGNPLRDTSGEALEAQRASTKRYMETLAATSAARAKDTSPSLPLDAYAGTYDDLLYGSVVVRAENGKLTLQFAGGFVADLEHWQHDSFRVHWRDELYGDVFPTYLAFGLDARGAVRRLDMRINRDEIEALRAP